MFQVIKYEGRARRGKFRCAHGGEVQTPVFMNVGTQAAICICAPAMMWCGRWAASTSLCAGTARS